MISRLSQQSDPGDTPALHSLIALSFRQFPTSSRFKELSTLLRGLYFRYRTLHSPHVLPTRSIYVLVFAQPWPFSTPETFHVVNLLAAKSSPAPCLTQVTGLLSSWFGKLLGNSNVDSTSWRAAYLFTSQLKAHHTSLPSWYWAPLSLSHSLTVLEASI